MEQMFEYYWEIIFPVVLRIVLTELENEIENSLFHLHAMSSYLFCSLQKCILLCSSNVLIWPWKEQYCMQVANASFKWQDSMFNY